MPLLLRSLLTETIVDPGPTRPDEHGADPAIAYVIVVARTEPALFQHLQWRCGADAKLTVVLDRRRLPGAPDRWWERAEEVGRRRPYRAVSVSRELVVLRRDRAVDPDQPDSEGSRAMNEVEILDEKQRVTRWLDESQYLLGRVIPGVLEDRERLSRTLEASEQECERLRHEVATLRRDLTALQAEVHGLRSERATIADAFGGIVNVLGQLQKPLEEIGRRLHAAPAALDTSVV
jgi:hypothetical protein